MGDRAPLLLVGLCSYFGALRFSGLNPLDIGWQIKDGLRVFGGDSTTHYLGWEFFRNGELTAWPPGRTTTLGPDSGASVMHTDSIPLMAIPARLLLRSLNFSEPFQYFGIWILLSFLLQAYLSGQLLLKLCAAKSTAYIGSILFSISPIFVYRMGYNVAIGSHWVILAVLILILNQKQSLGSWLLLSIIATAINPYLSVMVLLMYLSRLLSECLRTRHLEVRGLVVGCAMACSILATAYLGGLFEYGGESLNTGGFGDYTANLVSLVDPKVDDAIAIAPNWSSFDLLPDLPSGDQHQWEGFAYLGTGLLLLALLTSVRLLPALIRKRAWWLSVVGTVAVATAAGGIAPVSAAFLALIVGLLVIFHSVTLRVSRDAKRVLTVAVVLSMIIAVTHRVYVGTTLFALPVPEPLLRPFGFIRVSGRMVWIVVYVVMFVVIVLADHAFKRTSTLLSLGIIVILLQVFDGREGYQSTRDYINAPRTEFMLTSALWGDMAERYRHINFVVPRQVLHLDNPRPDQDQAQFSDDFWFAERQLWADLGEYAVKHKMSLNGFYFARTPEREYAAEALELQSVVARNAYREDTLYVFIDAPLWNQAKATHRESDAIGLLNGVPILAPGLRSCEDCALTDLLPVKPVSK